MKNEVWKTYPEFDFIQGSNLGWVRTLDRMVSNGKGTYTKKGRILKQCNSGGYLRVNFKMNGKTVTRSVHRIIASCFLSNPNNLPQINHKDCDRTNNCIDNLEWCDPSYNQQYREKYGESQGSPVIAINLKTQDILQSRSQREAGRVLNIDPSSITKVTKRKLNQTGSFWFVKADSYAVEATRTKFGDEVADKVEELICSCKNTKK